MNDVRAGLSPAERLKLSQHWGGQYRYIRMDEGERVILPDCMGTPFWKPEGLEREVCTGIDETGRPVWATCPDAPVPANLMSAERVAVTSEDPAAPSPPYDFVPPSYASDTTSGGPANFHGNAGGLENPRNPFVEGEVGGEYETAMASFQEQLAAMQGKQQEMENVILSGDEDKLKVFAAKLRAKKGDVD